MSGFRSVGRNGLQSADFRISPQNDDVSSVISSQYSDDAHATGSAGRNSPHPKLRAAVLGATGVVGPALRAEVGKSSQLRTRRRGRERTLGGQGLS